MTTNHAEWNAAAVLPSETRRQRSDRLFRAAGRRMSPEDMEKRNRRADARLDAHMRRYHKLPTCARALMASCLDGAAGYRRGGWLPLARRAVSSATDFRWLAYQESEVLP